MPLELESGQEASLAFCKAVLQVFRLTRLYDVDNVNVTDPLNNLKDLIIQVTDRMGSARLQAEDGVVYFNKDPVRGGRRAFATIQGVVEALENAGIAELAFTGACSLPELQTFFDLIKRAAGDLSAVKVGLEEAALRDRILVYAPGETTSAARVNQVEIDEATYFPLAYARTLVLLREYVKNLRTEELNRYFTQKLHRALQELCGMVSKYPHKFLAMASIKGAESYLYNHMANTGVLATLLGHNLGISRVKLSDLALAGMLHALGRFRGPPDLLERSQLGPQEAREDGRHPYRALAAILEGRKLTTKTLTASVVCFQFDLHRGRTKLRIPPEQHPFSMIVRVCEEYDALTSSLDDRPAMLPDQALKHMIENAEHYDPTVLTVFTNMLGLFPTGTTVSLSDGAVAVVVHPNPELPKRPLVAVVLDASGGPVDGDFLDLADKGPDGTYPVAITGTLDPKDLGINVPDYLL